MKIEITEKGGNIRRYDVVHPREKVLLRDELKKTYAGDTFDKATVYYDNLFARGTGGSTAKLEEGGDQPGISFGTLDELSAELGKYGV